MSKIGLLEFSLLKFSFHVCMIREWICPLYYESIFLYYCSTCIKNLFTRIQLFNRSIKLYNTGDNLTLANILALYHAASSEIDFWSGQGIFGAQTYNQRCPSSRTPLQPPLYSPATSRLITIMGKKTLLFHVYITVDARTKIIDYWLSHEVPVIHYTEISIFLEGWCFVSVATIK